MRIQSNPLISHAPQASQRGVVLFFALIALVVMSLAAVALVRSVDTSSMIANNLAFKRSATSASAEGTQTAVEWLYNQSMLNTSLNILTNPAHPLNNDNPALGYYSDSLSRDPLDHNSMKWDDTDSYHVGKDQGENDIRVIIQRMCRQPNTPAQNASCLYIGIPDAKNPQNITETTDVCNDLGECFPSGLSPALRITTQTKGPKNTLSHVQEFVY